MSWPRLRDLRTERLQEIHRRLEIPEPFPKFQATLLHGDLSKFKVKHLRLLLQLLQTEYATCFNIDLRVSVSGCKGDLTSRLQFLRDGRTDVEASGPPPPATPPINTAVPVPSPDDDPGGDTVAIPGLAPRTNATRVEEESSEGEEYLRRHAFPTLATSDAGNGTHCVDLDDTSAPSAVVTAGGACVVNATASPEVALRQVAERLREDPTLGGHQQPAFPTARWMGKEAIAVVPPVPKGTPKRRMVLRVSLTTEEHSGITKRKRLMSLHMVCLDAALLPAKWPDEISVSVQRKTVQVPHSSWRPKNTDVAWHRSVIPIDLSSHVSPLTTVVTIHVDVGMVESPLVFAVCSVRNMGVYKVIEEATRRIQCFSTSIDSCLEDMVASQSDDLISVAKSSVPVTDPITLARIQLPVKGRRCKHFGAFDLSTYITFSSRSRIWNCPECQAVCPVEELVHDPLLDAILQHPMVRDDEDCDHVIIFPDGTWQHRDNPSVLIDARQTPRKRHLEESDPEDLVLTQRSPGSAAKRPRTSGDEGTADCPIEL